MINRPYYRGSTAISGTVPVVLPPPSSPQPRVPAVTVVSPAILITVQPSIVYAYHVTNMYQIVCLLFLVGYPQPPEPVLLAEWHKMTYLMLTCCKTFMIVMLIYR